MFANYISHRQCFLSLKLHSQAFTHLVLRIVPQWTLDKGYQKTSVEITHLSPARLGLDHKLPIPRLTQVSARYSNHNHNPSKIFSVNYLVLKKSFLKFMDQSKLVCHEPRGKVGENNLNNLWVFFQKYSALLKLNSQEPGGGNAGFVISWHFRNWLL